MRRGGRRRAGVTRLQEGDVAARHDARLRRVVGADAAPRTQREVGVEAQHQGGAVRRRPLETRATTPANARGTETAVAEGVALAQPTDLGGGRHRAVVRHAGIAGLADLALDARRDRVHLSDARGRRTGGEQRQVVVVPHLVDEPGIARVVGLLPGGLGVSLLVAGAVRVGAQALGEGLPAHRRRRDGHGRPPVGRRVPPRAREHRDRADHHVQNRADHAKSLHVVTFTRRSFYGRKSAHSLTIIW